MVALGTKSVIMAMLLVRSAPGARWTSMPLTVFCVVDDRGSTVAVVAVTSTDPLALARRRLIFAVTTAPEATSIRFCCDAVPAICARNVYAPIGTVGKRNVPAASLLAVCRQL